MDKKLEKWLTRKSEGGTLLTKKKKIGFNKFFGIKMTGWMSWLHICKKFLCELFLAQDMGENVPKIHKMAISGDFWSNLTHFYPYLKLGKINIKNLADMESAHPVIHFDAKKYVKIQKKKFLWEGSPLLIFWLKMFLTFYLFDLETSVIPHFYQDHKHDQKTDGRI